MSDSQKFRYKVSLGGATLVIETVTKPTMHAHEGRDSIEIVLPGRAVAVQANQTADPDTIMHAQRLAAALKIPGVSWVTPDAGD